MLYVGRNISEELKVASRWDSHTITISAFCSLERAKRLVFFWCASDTSAVKTKNLRLWEESSLLLGSEFNLEFIWLYECAVCSS